VVFFFSEYDLELEIGLVPTQSPTAPFKSSTADDDEFHPELDELDSKDTTSLPRPS
jgi:hypothetical protein